MFLVSLACHQRDLHIGNRRTRKNTYMLPLLQVRENQPLPVPVQHILAAGGPGQYTASGFSRFQ